VTVTSGRNAFWFVITGANTLTAAPAPGRTATEAGRKAGTRRGYQRVGTDRHQSKLAQGVIVDSGQVLFNIIMGAAAFFGGWILNNISRTIERLDKDVRNLPHMYVTRADYRADIDEIKAMLNRINDKLDEKADK